MTREESELREDGEVGQDYQRLDKVSAPADWGYFNSSDGVGSMPSAGWDLHKMAATFGGSPHLERNLSAVEFTHGEEQWDQDPALPDFERLSEEHATLQAMLGENELVADLASELAQHHPALHKSNSFAGTTGFSNSYFGGQMVNGLDSRSPPLAHPRPVRDLSLKELNSFSSFAPLDSPTTDVFVDGPSSLPTNYYDQVAHRFWMHEQLQREHALRLQKYHRRSLMPHSPMVPDLDYTGKPIHPDVFSLAALIDRQRSIHVSNIPEDTSKQEIYWLFDSVADGLFQSCGDALVTHVLFRGGAFAWVEFQTEAMAAEVLRFCKENAELVQLGAGKQKLWVQRPNGYDPRRSSLAQSTPLSPNGSGLFDLDYTVDRQRSLHVDNLPKGAAARGLWELFESMLRETRAGAAMQGPLVTHVLFKGGHFAWVEFQTEHLASLALGICNRDGAVLQVGSSCVRLVVQRPVGYEYRSEGEERKAGDKQYQALSTRSPSGVTDLFSFNYKVDRQRALHVDNLPGDVTAEKILRHFEFVVHHTQYFENPADISTAVTHVLYPGRSFAWVEFCSPALAGCVLDLCERSLDAVWMGGRNGVRLLVQRPRGYCENPSRSDISSQLDQSPGYLGPSHPDSPASRTPSLDADSFPSLQAATHHLSRSSSRSKQWQDMERQLSSSQLALLASLTGPQASAPEKGSDVTHFLPQFLGPSSQTGSPTWSAQSDPQSPLSPADTASLEKVAVAFEPWSLFSAAPAVSLPPPPSELSLDSSQRGSSRRSSLDLSNSLFASSVVESCGDSDKSGNTSPPSSRFQSFFSKANSKSRPGSPKSKPAALEPALNVQTSLKASATAWPSIWSPQTTGTEFSSPETSPSYSGESTMQQLQNFYRLSLTPSVAANQPLSVMRSSGCYAGEGFDPLERWAPLRELNASGVTL